MKLYNLPAHIYLLIYSCAFMTSCNGQVKSASREMTQSPNTSSAIQISDYVVEVFEDTKGNLWLGTMGNGVARYDGKTLTYFSTKDGICGNDVCSIAEDREGNMWFGTHNGAAKYDGKSFTNFGDNKGLTGAGCNILIDKHGNIWAGTNNGAFRYNGTAFTSFDLPIPEIAGTSYKWEAGKIWSLIEDSKGNIWFGRDGFGACKYDGKSFTHFTRKDGLCSNNVGSIIEDNEGNIWFGSLTSDKPQPVNEGGVCRYDGNTFTKYPNIEGLTQNDIYSIYKDHAGNVWIGAIHYGVYRYDGKNFTLFKETDRKDLIYNFGVQSIYEDRNGILWFGFSGGLFRFNGTAFLNVTQDGPWQ